MKRFLLSMTAIFFAIALNAQECTDLFISEYVEGSGNNKAIELYNPIDLSTYQLVRYSNGGYEPHAVGLTGTIDPKSTFVVVLDKRDPNGTGFEQPIDSALMEKADIFLCPVYEVNRMMYFNGNDAVTLEKTTGEVIDIFAFIGPPMTSDDNGWGNLNDTTITYNSQGNPTQYTISNYIVGPLFWLAWTKDHTLIRKTNVSYGVTENPDPYFIVDQQWDSIPENTFDSLGSHYCDCTTFGIDEEAIRATMNVYPNPVGDHIINIESNQKISSVKLFDINGRTILFEEMESPMFTNTLGIPESFSGVLFVTTKLESGISKTRKILVK